MRSVKLLSLCCRRVQIVGGDASSVTIFTLYSWCEQIAKGMGHLASKQVAVVYMIHHMVNRIECCIIIR